MTRTTRCLALLTMGLLGACSEGASATPTSTELPKTPQLMKGAELEPKQLPSLTATTPALPASIVDQPMQHESAAGSDTLGKKEGEEKKPEEKKGKVEEASHAEPVDFERPLDPKEVKIDRFVLATDVKQREPIGESEVFTTDTKQIFAFVQLANDEGAPYAFRVHWEKKDEPASRYGVKLDVPTAARFRTWSWTRIQRSPGQYRAVLRTLAGEEIASREFVIEAALSE